MENSSSYFEIMDILKLNQIIIYGTGFVARRFYDVLCMHGLDKNIGCFVVSKRDGNLNYINGIQVRSISEYSNNNGNIICIAVHETIKDEIVDVLRRKRFENYIWIYPCLNELYLGKPIKRNVKVSVDSIIRKNCDYRLAVRLLALENYLKENDYGFEIYRKAQRLYCSKATTEKRMESFCRLIQNWERHGYRQDSKILIDEKGQLLDGTHRITLAKYFRTGGINCDIFGYAPNYFVWCGEKATLTKRQMEKVFTDKEIEIVKDAYLRIRSEE